MSLQDAAPLAAIDVTKTFVVDPVLRGVSLRVEAGRMVVSAGDSGVVELVEFYGHDTVYAVRLDAGAGGGAGGVAGGGAPGPGRPVGRGPRGGAPCRRHGGQP